MGAFTDWLSIPRPSGVPPTPRLLGPKSTPLSFAAGIGTTAQQSRQMQSNEYDIVKGIADNLARGLSYNMSMLGLFDWFWD